jgi:hypothetical protein
MFITKSIWTSYLFVATSFVETKSYQLLLFPLPELLVFFRERLSFQDGGVVGTRFVVDGHGKIPKEDLQPDSWID